MAHTKTTTLADIEAEQQRLAAEAERLREQAAEARRIEAEKRERQLDADAAKLLDDYDATASDAEVKQAEQNLRAAVLADPVYSAAIDLLAARINRYEHGVRLSAAAQRLNVTAPAAAPVSGLDLHEYVGRMIQNEGANRAEDLREGRG